MHQMESVSQSRPAVAGDNRVVQMMLRRCSRHAVAARFASKCFWQIASWRGFIRSRSPRLWPDAVPWVCLKKKQKNITFKKNRKNGNEPFQFGLYLQEFCCAKHFYLQKERVHLFWWPQRRRTWIRSGFHHCYSFRSSAGTRKVVRSNGTPEKWNWH